jgi:hypothetical protein
VITASVQEKLAARGITSEPPYGCRWCGDEQQHHGQQWAPIIGMHSWLEPSQAMILERMRRRRAARQTTVPPLFHATTGWAPDLTGESADPYCADCGRESCPRWNRIQTRLDRQRSGLPRRVRRSRRSRKTADAGGGWGGDQPWPF